MTKQMTPFGVFRVGCGRQTVMHLPSRRLVDAQLASLVVRIRIMDLTGTGLWC